MQSMWLVVQESLVVALKFVVAVRLKRHNDNLEWVVVSVCSPENGSMRNTFMVGADQGGVSIPGSTADAWRQFELDLEDLR